MSSARKPQSELPKIRKTQPKRHISIVDAKSHFDAITPPVRLNLERMFNALHALAPQSDLFLGHYSRISASLQVELADGGFTSLKGLSLKAKTGALAERLYSKSAIMRVSQAALKASNPAFDLCHPDGTAFLFRLDLREDEIFFLVLFTRKEQALDNSRLEAVRSVIELAVQACASDDFALEIQAQNLQLTSLHTEIKQTKTFFHEFSNTIRQCYWILDIENAQARIISENFEDVWGANRRILADGLAGFMANVHANDRDRILSEFHTQLGQEFETELRTIGHDGEVRWIWLRSYPTQATAVKEILLVADDITDKKTQEEVLRAREADLVSSARTIAVVDLASGVAHEINNPLTIIVNKADEGLRALKKPEFSVETLKETLQKIQETSRRIADIVKSLKALARREKSLTYRETNVTKLFRDISDLVSEKFRAADVVLELPTFPEDLSFVVNDTMIAQMLLNLLNNAFDAVQEQEKKWVTIDWTDNDESIFFYITDSGPGIPIKIRGRIFDPFFTTKPPGKGTGLGLSLAASIASHHEGQIRLDTHHPHTRFVIQLPKRLR